MTKLDTPRFQSVHTLKHYGVCVLCFLVAQSVFAQDNDYTAVELQSLAYVDSSKSYIEKNLDTALAYADSANALRDQIEAVEIKTKVFINLGDVYSEIASMDLALKYYLDAKSTLSNAQIKDTENERHLMDEIDVLISIGVLYYHQGNFDKCLAQYEEALSILEQEIENAPEEEVATKKIRLFNNIAALYIQNLDYNTALAYYQNALEINKSFGNKRYESSLENNIGICYLEKGEYDLANHHFLKALNLNKDLDNKRGEAQALNNIGKNQATKGNFIKAKDYFEQALSLGYEIGNGNSILVSLESLALTYDTLGQYKKALNTYMAYKSLNDSIFSADSHTAMAKLEDTFRRDKEKKLFEIEVQREKADRQKAELRNIKIGAALLSLLLLAALIIVWMRGKIKTAKLNEQKLNLEHENLELERRTLQENLDFKDRELTANALFLIKNNELISKITEKLLQAKDTFKQENQKIIQDIIYELRSSQDKNLWEEFEAHFTRVHSDFYQKLQEQFPNLSANEKKLCAFLRLNMSTKDISAITYQSINSITVARSRLRKKLNIEGEDIHLVNFLMEF